MSIEPEIQYGCRVSLHVRIRTADGRVVEDTFDEAPLELVMGDGTLHPNLELGLYGMKAGQEQTLTLSSRQAFGERDPANVHWLDRADFPADIEPEPGLIIGFATPEGEEIPGSVLEVEAERVRVDFNHPLAGKPIHFDARILKVELPDHDA
ncbi:FKBP-type peptidyl-prolyl cis-trans isomerase [Thiohalobacter thiocyanaticus]|uniref:Peptidyl-prolyl cis-trans isomerase n=1 Tax=Thiohalobacter thiocyanaticus TaxID=585455 RepID=A0A426QHT2_9GAMM|nr:peptidylprolyl isomerase [Thiohalobacter thiocyanaticus]RRQ21325.1 peptidylprolyl isomerase [Thiohalobacter thiocyanaticus]